MRTLLILAAVASLGACSMRDTVDMAGATAQVHDLNDQDKDGVIVAREKCMSTMTGAEIDNYGCGTVATNKERKELKVQFANDSYYLAPKYYGQLEDIATFMRKFPNTNVVIEGHCSKTGSHQHNLELSKNRAQAVTSVLTEKFSIDPMRLEAIGYSFDKPVDDSESAYAHAKNRRVVAEIQGKDTAAAYKWTIYTVDQDDKL
ncbi:hypothetical protein SOPP22_04775 [Shewanella sp. OPT22]|nr:hypothetical protein SOPP22_04775 [Shewanella sp. OPT22]